MKTYCDKIKKLAFTAIIILTTQISVYAQQSTLIQDKNSTPLVLCIKFKTTPENAEGFKNVLVKLFDTISHEQNFVAADLHQAIGKPEEFLVYETWNDTVSHFINVQMKKTYAVEFEKVLKQMNVERSPEAYTSFGHWSKK